MFSSILWSSRDQNTETNKEEIKGDVIGLKYKSSNHWVIEIVKLATSQPLY
jgi:hypothetical protein